MILEWNHRKCKKTIPIDTKSSNIGKMYTVPGFTKYEAYATKTDNLFPNVRKMACFRLEVQDKDEVLIEDEKELYKSADREDDKLITANVEIKKV
jgi:hypothetical protein